MKTKANPDNNAPATRETDELRDTLFRTLSDLRAGRITAQEAKIVTTAATKALFGPSSARPVRASGVLSCCAVGQG